MVKVLFQKRYRPENELDDDGSSEKLLGAHSQPSTSTTRSIDAWTRIWWPWVAHGIFFTLYTVVFLGLILHTYDRQTEATKKLCLLQHSTYSPVHDIVEYSSVRFNGSLNFPSPYRGPPTPEVDVAWDRITTNNSLWPIRVSDQDIENFNKGGRPSNVRFWEEDGGGNMGSIEVFHQLHCLNMLRKFTYPKEYPEVQELWTTRPQFLRSHLDHCIEMIRQNLMCVADVGVISYDWVSGWEVPFPDFNTWHKCRNFDDILDWTTAHRVHIPTGHMKRIGDEIDLPKQSQRWSISFKSQKLVVWTEGCWCIMDCD